MARGHGANRAPVAVDDAATVVEDATPNWVTGNVLANDRDPDRDRLVVRAGVGIPLAHGSLTIRADGSFRYTLDNTDTDVQALNSGGTLTDAYTYTVVDPRGATDTATIRIRIKGVTDNRAPVAVDDAATVVEDATPNWVTGNVLANDRDPDRDRLFVRTGTFTLAHGTLVLNADGSFRFTLDNTDTDVQALNDGDSLTDTFTYNISDGHGGTATATLRIRINGVTDNQLPVADDDLAVVREDTAPNPITGNVLDNDSDPDTDLLSVTNTGTFTLAHGTLVLNADGSFRYTLDNTNTDVQALNDGDSLTDTFTYNISDGHGGTATATLRIRINGVTDLIPV